MRQAIPSFIPAISSLLDNLNDLYPMFDDFFIHQISL